MSNLRQRIKSLGDSLSLPAGFRENYRDSSNGMAVFVSVMAAILIWFMISMRESYSVLSEFPIEYVNMAPDTAFAMEPTRSIQVRVEGAGWQLLKLYTANDPIQIDASLASVDLFSAAVRSLAPDLIPRSVTPAQIILPLELRTTVTLPIVLDAQIATVPPFELVNSIRIEPDSVVVSGAVSVLAKLEFWPTETLQLDHVNTSFSTSVALSDTLSGLVDRSIDKISTFGEVTEFTENTRLLDVVVTDTLSGKGRFRLIPDQVSVTYRVPISQFEASAVTDSFYATVSYRDILSDTTGRVSPKIQLPGNIVVKDLTIETARLRYYVVLE